MPQETSAISDALQGVVTGKPLATRVVPGNVSLQYEHDIPTNFMNFRVGSPVFQSNFI
jgi:hypothetical protein